MGFAVLTALFVVLSCGDNPTGSPEPESDFEVFLPDSNTVWHLWQIEAPVEYDLQPIAESYWIWVEVLKSDSTVIPIAKLRNTGSISIPDQIPTVCWMGDDFRIRLYTAEGDTGVSAEFSIQGYEIGDFAEIPAGSFQMGSDSTEWFHQPDESPVHTVTFSSPFEMMTTEVPQRIWVNVVGFSPSEFLGDSLPVEYVNWNDCQDFIEGLSAIDPDYDYRLPTEAEWEYAARAGTETCFYWGDDNTPAVVGQYGWYNPNSGNSTHVIGSLEPNQWGLYDMLGNVFEWCQDVHHDDYTGAPSDGSAWISGGNQGSRIVRGGSWSNNAQFLRCASRSSLNEETRSISCGLRLIREEE
jgi:hypothetical protein